MASRYDKLKTAHANGGHAFIPFTLLGWPNAESSYQIVQALIDGGASALELGIAFSDPVADGPIIQAAAYKTIESGFKLVDAFALLKRVREYNADIPIGLLVYYNTALSQGLDGFYKAAAAAGVDSILIADLPAECAAEVGEAARKHNIEQVFIISPLTDKQRLQRIAQVASGYLYVVSRLGITGVQADYDNELESLLQRAKNLSDLPLYVGFGISTPEQAKRMISMGADGVITGSRVVQLMREKLDLEALRRYICSMNEATGGVANIAKSF